jgi:hypothetical protein
MALGLPQPMAYTGTAPTFAAAAALDFVQPDNARFLVVRNGSGVSTTVAIGVPGVTFDQANPDISVVIPAGQERFIGPMALELADPGAANLVVITVSPTASVTIAAFDFPPLEPDLPT